MFSYQGLLSSSWTCMFKQYIGTFHLYMVIIGFATSFGIEIMDGNFAKASANCLSSLERYVNCKYLKCIVIFSDCS